MKSFRGKQQWMILNYDDCFYRTKMIVTKLETENLGLEISIKKTESISKLGREMKEWFDNSLTSK